MLAANEPGLVERLLLLSYPLHPPNQPAKLRTSHFSALHVPALFVHGVRDGFGSIPEMEAALKTIPACSQLIAIPGAGHELLTNRNRDEFTGKIVTALLSFTQ
jgi:predicted alpha/beta-hydrolase family hydrolase